MAQIIFESENFEFVREEGIGINNTPWKGLKVKSKGLAKKHVVEIRLRTYNNPKFDGTPVVWQYTNAEVGHGYRCERDTLQDTREYIQVLQDAVEFAESINNWFFKNDYHA